MAGKWGEDGRGLTTALPWVTSEAGQWGSRIRLGLQVSHGEGKVSPGMKKPAGPPGAATLPGEARKTEAGRREDSLDPPVGLSSRPPLVPARPFPEGPLAGPQKGPRWVCRGPVSRSESQLPGAALTVSHEVRAQPGVRRGGWSTSRRVPQSLVRGWGGQVSFSRGTGKGWGEVRKEGRGGNCRGTPPVRRGWTVTHSSLQRTGGQGPRAPSSPGRLLRWGTGWAAGRGPGCNSFFPAANAWAAGAGSSPEALGRGW